MEKKDKEEELLNKLKQVIGNYLDYDLNPFAGGGEEPYKTSQKYQSAAKIISNKLQQYINDYPDDKEVRDVVIDKLGERGLKDFIVGNYPTDILDYKTLDRFEKSQNPLKTNSPKTASETTKRILQAFHRITDKESELYDLFDKKIAGYFSKYVSHSTTKKVGRFQYSLCKFARKGQRLTGFVYYKDRNRQLRHSRLKLEMVNETTLIATNADKSDLLTFYIYLGGLTDEESGRKEQTNNEGGKPKFLQAVFLYRNRFDNLVANLAMLERLPEKYQDFENIEKEEEFVRNFNPKRELKQLPEAENPTLVRRTSIKGLTVRKNIQYFLAQYAKPLQTLRFENIFPFNFKETAFYNAQHFKERPLYYESTYELRGFYHVYFYERYPWKQSDSFPQQTEDFSTIGVGMLQIYEGKTTGILRCELYIKRNESKTLIFRGEIESKKFKSPAYIILSTYLHREHHRYVNIIFKITNEETLIGCFNITYLQTGKLGAGVAIAKKIVGKHRDNLSDEQRDQLMMSAHAVYAQDHHPDIPSTITNFLSRRRNASVYIPDESELEAYQDNIYQGIYIMHTKTNITYLPAILIIYKNGMAIFENIQGERSSGECDLSDNNLDIVFRNSTTKRQWFCSIRVDGIAPTSYPYRSCYLAVIAGAAAVKDNYRPLSYHYIVEFVRAKDMPPLDQLSHFLRESVKNPPEQISDFMHKYFPVSSETPLFFSMAELEATLK